MVANGLSDALMKVIAYFEIFICGPAANSPEQEIGMKTFGEIFILVRIADKAGVILDRLSMLSVLLHLIDEWLYKKIAYSCLQVWFCQEIGANVLDIARWENGVFETSTVLCTVEYTHPKNTLAIWRRCLQEPGFINQCVQICICFKSLNLMY